MRNKLSFPYPKAQGSALIVILILLGLAIALLVSALKSNPQIERDKVTADALARAKDALIGYAVSPTGSGQRPGDLLRPDSFATTETPPDYNGKSETGCMDATKANGLPLIAGGATTRQNLRCLGRLPWVDLNIPIPSADENDPTGSMPWYAVSANLVDPVCLEILNSDSATLPQPPLNVDTTRSYSAPTCAAFPNLPAQLPHPWLTVRDEKGNVISDRVAAILLIPGSPLSTQNRPPSPNLAGPTGYLDSITISAGCGAPCVPGTYSNADMDNDFIMGNPSNTFNDKVLFITIDELMAAVAKRIAGDAGNALKAFYNTCGFYPRPVNFATSSCYTGTTCASDPSLTQGRFPYSAKPAGTGASYPTWTLPTWFLENRWDSVLYYAVSGGFTSNSDGSPLITVDGSATARALFFTPAINTPTINRVATPTTLTNYLLTAENTNVDTTFIFNNTKEKGYMRNGLSNQDLSSYSPSSPNPICSASPPPPPPVVGGTPITLDATTITAACSGVCGSSGIDTGETTLTLAGTPALTITATGGTIGRNQGGASTDAIGVYQGGGSSNTALQAGETLALKLTSNTALKFGISFYDFSAGDQALLTFMNSGSLVGTYTATTATTANITPGGAFDEVIVQAIGTATFWIQTVKFCDALTPC